MDISSITNTGALQAYTKASTVDHTVSAPADNTATITQGTASINTHPSNPVNASSTPVPSDTNTAPVYTAVGNASASIIRGSGIDITA